MLLAAGRCVLCTPSYRLTLDGKQGGDEVPRVGTRAQRGSVWQSIPLEPKTLLWDGAMEANRSLNSFNPFRLFKFVTSRPQILVVKGES